MSGRVDGKVVVVSGAGRGQGAAEARLLACEALIAFLLSDDASFITGVDIPVDGGLTAHGGVKSISDATRVLPRSC